MSKIITITDELYNLLKTMKGENESFSKIISRNVKNGGNKDRVLANIKKYKKEIRKAFEGVDSLGYVMGVRKNWNWDRYSE